MAPSSYNSFAQLSCSVCSASQDSIKSLHYHQTFFHSTQELSLALLSLKGWDVNLLMQYSEDRSWSENGECQVYYQNGKVVNRCSGVSQQDEDVTCKIENGNYSPVKDGHANEAEKCTLNDTLNSVKMSNDILINDLDKSPPSQVDTESLQVGYYEDTPPGRWPVTFGQELNLKSDDILSDSETDTDIEVEANEKLFDSDCEMKVDALDLYNSYKGPFTTGESVSCREQGGFSIGRMFHKNYLERSKLQNEMVGTSMLQANVEEENLDCDSSSVCVLENSKSHSPKMKEEADSSLSTDNIIVNNRRMLYDFPLSGDAKSLERDTDFVDFFLSPADIDSENLSDKCESPDIFDGDPQKDGEEDRDTTHPSECILLDKNSKTFRKWKTPNEFLEICSDEKPSDLTVTQNGDSTRSCFGGFFKAKAILGLGASKVSERRFFCESCGKGYKKKSHLERHLRVHTGERPFPCPYCTKRFAVRSILKQHIRIHTGEKPYSCDICSQRFPQKSGLMTHMMLHTGKPFKCDVCDKSFVSNHKLLQHLKGHDSQHKSYSCGKCSLVFFTLGALAVHEAVHKKEPGHHVCQKCEEGFDDEALLEAHVGKCAST